MIAMQPGSLVNVVIGLDRWFDAMRVDWPTRGYGGPVVHWWNHSLAYRGAGLDWRYEGIIDGYLARWRATNEREWLDKAIRAGSDLVEGQLANGQYRNSAFELNPTSGGTPHEAAADVGLLLLAHELRVADPVASQRFLDTARHNLEAYWFDQLWHQPSSTLRDARGEPTFVPNKAATFIDAVLLLSELTKRDDLVEQYALPTAAKIIEMQVTGPESGLSGAIAQNRFGDRVIDAYFPLYIARIIPPILRLYERTGDLRLHGAALAAARFLEGIREPDGGFPQVIYGNGKTNRRPRWIAGSGDILRAFVMANQHGAEIDVSPSIDWLLRGVRPDGHIATAEGFDRIIPLVSRRDRFADELGVVGWCDKAFRALALLTLGEQSQRAVAGTSNAVAVIGSTA
ncbi:MAG TPA: hypothetical protein VF201_13725 [Nitrolancea sp.]